MRNRAVGAKVVLLCLAMILAIVIAAAATPDINVRGTWNIKVSGDAGSADQTIVLQQDANKITGKFKGPDKPATWRARLNGNEIRFHVKTRVPLDYPGTVDGGTMKVTMSGKGKTGDWRATRSK